MGGATVPRDEVGETGRRSTRPVLRRDDLAEAPAPVVAIATPPQTDRPALVGLQKDDGAQLAEGGAPRPPGPLGGAWPQRQADVQPVPHLVIEAPVASRA